MHPPECDDARNDRRAEFLARPQCAGASLAAKGSAMLEVFTVGGGEYLVNTFNAVAAWSGGGGYKSLIRVVMVMGLIYSLLVVTFTLNYRVWLNWFLQATAIYLCLMVPTVDIKVTDRSEEHTSELQSLMRISYA